MFRFKVKESKFALLDERKWYPARLNSVETDELTFNNKPQPKFKFNFVILDPDEFEGRELHGMVNQPQGDELTERHTLYAWITALRDGRPLTLDEEIDFPEQFYGKIVLIQVKNSVKNYDGKEMTFQNVKKIAVCNNAADYTRRAADKMPERVDPALAPEGTPETPDAPTPETPAEEPEAPAPEPTPEASSEPAPETDSGPTVMVDGEEIECPF